MVSYLADELEAGEDVEEADIMSAADFGYDFGRDYCFDGVGVFGHAGGFIRFDDVVEEERAYLISGQADEFAGLVAGHDAHSVGVGIGRDYEVASDFFGELYAEFEYRRVFGVREGDGREVAVRDHLLLNRVDVLQSDSLQDFRNENSAGAVERCVDDLQVVRYLRDYVGVDGFGDDFREVGLDEVVSDIGDEPGLYAIVKGYHLHVVKNIGGGYELGDGLRVVRRELRAVVPVRLVAVVLLRVV